MKIQFRAFNIYFLMVCLTLATQVSFGADGSPKANASAIPEKTSEKSEAKEADKKKKKRKKVISTLRVHLEVNRDGTDRITTVQVLRSSPISVTIDREPIVTEAYLVGAKVVSTVGGPEIELQFDSQGRTFLQNYSAANRGRRLAIYCDFDKEHRWLAAPVMTSLNSNGVLRFAPDATPEEMERIVEGLLTIAEIKKKENKF